MTEKTFKKWLEQTKQDCWSENDIIYFRKAINGSSTCTEQQRSILIENMKDSYALHPEQQDKGTKYLLSKSLKLNGERRKNCVLGDFELNILKQDPIHQLVGVYNISENSFIHYVPVYRAIAPNGDYFDYLGVCYDMLRVLDIGRLFEDNERGAK